MLIVEDHEVIRRGLGLVLRSEGFEIAGAVGRLGHARAMLARRRPKVAVVGVDLEGGSGFELIPAARAAGTRVLIYSDSIEQHLVDAAAAAGAEGLASRASRPGELFEALRAIGSGQRFLDRRFTVLGDSPPRRLTAREREVVTLVAAGLTGEQIAVRLYLAPETVRTHIRNSMQRLGARTRAHLVTLAAQTSEIELPRAE